MVAGVALQNRSTATPSIGESSTLSPSPTSVPSTVPSAAPKTRSGKIEFILADLMAPLNEQAINWLTDTDTWEPAAEDPESDYLWIERYVMVDLYFSTNGTNWDSAENWLSTGEPV